MEIKTKVGMVEITQKIKDDERLCGCRRISKKQIRENQTWSLPVHGYARDAE